MTLTGRGLSERQIVESLSGTVQVALGPGAIHGFSLEKAIAGLGQGRMPTGQLTPGDKTPFTEASISFQLTNGIAESRDLKIVSPLATAGGAGQVNLVKQTIDYQMRPKLGGSAGAVSIPGLGAQVNLAGMEVPIRVRGDLDRPQIIPEMGSVTRAAGAAALGQVTRDPAAALDAAKGNHPERRRRHRPWRARRRPGSPEKSARCVARFPQAVTSEARRRTPCGPSKKCAFAGKILPTMGVLPQPCVNDLDGRFSFFTDQGPIAPCVRGSFPSYAPPSVCKSALKLRKLLKPIGCPQGKERRVKYLSAGWGGSNGL